MIARMIERNLTPKLLETLSYSPAIALIGPRQVGKTTLALEAAKASGQPFIYLDLESEIDRAKLAQAELYLSDQADKLIILDEIHRLPGLFPILRGQIVRNGKIVYVRTDDSGYQVSLLAGTYAFTVTL